MEKSWNCVFEFLWESWIRIVMLLNRACFSMVNQGSHRLETYLNLEGLLEKSLKIKSALKSTGKSIKGLEKSLNSTIFCRTQQC